MSRPRITGRNVTLLVNSSQLLLPIALGEFEEFTARSNMEIIKRRPMGKTIEAANIRYGGYDLCVKIGKTDPMLERWNHLVERGHFAGNSQPDLFIIETIKHYDTILGVDVIENWIYRNVVLYGLDKSTDPEEISQKIEGFATHKEIGPADVSVLNLNWALGIGYQATVHRMAATSKMDIGGAILGALGAVGNIFS